jgi:hypothetical protein
MSPEAILERLEALGVSVSLTGDCEHPLRLAPADRIPLELRPEVVAHKAELAELVARQAGVWQADPSALAWPSNVGEDPRPDLAGSELWTALLQLASGDADDPQGTYGRLKAARACGAVLELRAGRWKLAPTIDPTERLSTWQDRETWDRDAATWLKPKSGEIVDLLRRLPVPTGVGE